MFEIQRICRCRVMTAVKRFALSIIIVISAVNFAPFSVAQAAIVRLSQPGIDIVVGETSPGVFVYAEAADGFNITRDIDNGLEWLDWKLTNAMSFDAVSANLLGSGQVLDGWRYATGAELSLLAISAGVSSDCFDAFCSVSPTDPLAVLYRSLVDDDIRPFFGAVFSETTADLLGHYLGVIRAYDEAFLSRPDVLTGPDASSQLNSSGPSGVGNALVRDTNAAAIPLPASLSLFLSGLIGFGLMRRRRNQA
jgi:hypothetical protein